MYFSEAALNEIDDGRYTTSAENSVGLTSKLLTFTRQTTVSNQPGSADRADSALKRARKAGRPTWHDLHDLTGAGSVFDIEVTDLHVGVMPFAYFGCYGEAPFRSRRGRVRVFWAQALVPPRRWRTLDSPRELILLGSLNRLTNQPWNGADESALKIGHSYPSDPSVLSMLVQTELQLEDPSVQSHIGSVNKYEELEAGRSAAFASAQTARARKALVRDEGFITHWERRPALRRARVVAITNDIWDSSEDANARSTLLARPILIRDLSS
jgi:hypothetical protein